jgi:hypothetical protein
LSPRFADQIDADVLDAVLSPNLLPEAIHMLASFSHSCRIALTGHRPAYSLLEFGSKVRRDHAEGLLLHIVIFLSVTLLSMA